MEATFPWVAKNLCPGKVFLCITCLSLPMGERRGHFDAVSSCSTPQWTWKRLLLLLTITIQNFCIVNCITQGPRYSRPHYRDLSVECHSSECGITLKKSLLALSDVPQKTIIGCDCWLMLSAFGPHAIWRDADVMKNLCSRPIFYSPSHHKVLVFMYDIWEARIPNQLGKKNSFIFFFV